jgi:hypothetical protein
LIQELSLDQEDYKGNDDLVEEESELNLIHVETSCKGNFLFCIIFFVISDIRLLLLSYELIFYFSRFIIWFSLWVWFVAF